MKRVKTTTFFIILVLVFLLNVIPSYAGNYQRSMWVWGGDVKDALDDELKTEELLNFSVNKDIKTLYFCTYTDTARSYINTNAGQYRSFISDAHNRNINVHALVYPAQHYFLPYKRSDALEVITDVLDYNSSSSYGERFDGLNVNLEPHSMQDYWWDNQPLHSELYLDMLSEQRQLVDDSGQDVKFGASVPSWYDSRQPLDAITWADQTKPLCEHIQDITDYVSIMDYKNNADEIYLDVHNELIYADTMGRAVVVGVETQDVEREPPSITFYGFEESVMEGILNEAESNLSTHISYDGLALHHYGSYKDMAVHTPEPSTIMLFGTSLMTLIGFGGLRKRKK